MDRKMRIWGLAGAVLLVGWGLAGRCEAVDLVGKKAPDFKLPDIEENEVTLSQFAGKVVVLNFWQTTCLPCIEEMPDLVAIYDEYQAKGLVVIGLAVKDNPAEVQNKAEVMRVRYPVLMDNMAVRMLYGIESVPHTFVIDKKGIVRQHFDRATDKAAIEAAVKPLLDEKVEEAK